MVVVLDFVVAGVVAVRLTVRVELAGAAVRVLCVVEVVVVFVVVAAAAAPLVVVVAAPLVLVPTLLPVDGCSIDEAVAGVAEIDWLGSGSGLLITEAIN